MGFTEVNKWVHLEKRGLSFGASVDRPLLPFPGAGSCEGDKLLFRLSGAPSLTALPPGGQEGSLVRTVQSPRPQPGQKLLWDLGLSEGLPAAPCLSKAAVQQGGQSWTRRPGGSKRGHVPTWKRMGSRLSFQPPRTSEHLTAGSSVPSLRRPRSSTKMWELGFSAGTVTPSPDKRDGRNCPCLCHCLSVSRLAGLDINVCVVLPPRHGAWRRWGPKTPPNTHNRSQCQNRASFTFMLR